MNKKTYQQPSVKVVTVEPHTLICESDTLNYGNWSNDDEKPKKDSGYYWGD